MTDATPLWHINEVSDEAREAAASAAEANGLSLGAWLTRLIEESSAPEEEHTPGRDEKLTSIERAMLRTRGSGN